MLLIEAGRDVTPGAEPSDILARFPVSMFNPQYQWPNLKVHARTEETSPAIPFPQGRIVGGTSAINGMWALRGVPADYDEWQALGARDWDWEGVLPFFRKLETDRDFAGPMHGADGPVQVGRQPPAEWAPFDVALVKALRARDWPLVADMNGEFQDGVGVLPVSASASQRSSAGIAYLSAEVRRRPNLKVRVDTAVRRLIFKGPEVAGVSLLRGDGSSEEVRGGEVILAAGALHTPLLLLRSGVGPAGELSSLGVAVRADRPGVGLNLQNHPMVAMMGLVRRGARHPKRFRSAGATYLRWSSGLQGCAPSDLSMWVRPEISWHALGRRIAGLYPVLARPISRGSVRLNRKGADAAPRIEFNFLDDARDLQRMKSAFRLAAGLFTAAEMGRVVSDPFVLTQPMSLLRYNTPGRSNAWRTAMASVLVDGSPRLGAALIGRLGGAVPANKILADEAEFDGFIRRHTIGTGHVSGTCRMGEASDPTAVVGPDGRVHGVAGLRVSDASVMPRVPSGNTQIPTIMAAEKIAAAVLADR